MFLINCNHHLLNQIGDSRGLNTVSQQILSINSVCKFSRFIYISATKKCIDRSVLNNKDTLFSEIQWEKTLHKRSTRTKMLLVLLSNCLTVVGFMLFSKK